MGPNKGGQQSHVHGTLTCIKGPKTHQLGRLSLLEIHTKKNELRDWGRLGGYFSLDPVLIVEYSLPAEPDQL